MYCKKCGKQIADDSIFCSFCGTKVEHIEINQDNVDNKNTANKDQKTNNKKWIFIVVITVLVLVLLYVVIGVVRSNRADRAMDRMVQEVVDEVKHKYSFVGTYNNSEPGSAHVKVELNGDNTAVLYLGDNSYRRYEYRGYWSVSNNSDIVEITFTQSFELFGSKYNTTIYLYDDRLWQSITAIRAKDYRHSEYVTKYDPEKERIKEEKRQAEIEASMRTEESQQNEKKYLGLGYKPIYNGSSVLYKEIKKGNGSIVLKDDLFKMKYEMRLLNGTIVLCDSVGNSLLRRESLVTGLGEAVGYMKAGSKWDIYVPCNKAYKNNYFINGGDTIFGPYTDLLYTVEIISITGK